MTTTNPATDTQIEQLRLRAVNDTTREIMASGITLTHDQVDELGEETIAWIGGRLGLNKSKTEGGITFAPPAHYVGRDEDGNLITADDASH